MSGSTQMIQPPAFVLDPAQSGLELALRWIEMVWPGGFVNRLAARPVEAAEGFIRVECEVDPGHSNFVGLVHGGVTAALVDIVGGGAAMTLLKPGEFLLSTDLSMRFLNAAPIGCERLIAEGRAVYADPRKVVAEVTISTLEGLTIAHGTAAIAIRVRSPD
ncbi:PaaI family thioesterase [Brevundimonas sp.]|uniref:PaaI family thioesterase n=1 Tax=Brevundimonas sp. TaxID=1871086 RepID=UPI002899B343|nr:PaaI family thioesterase [Brevundimonas sp.]